MDLTLEEYKEATYHGGRVRVQLHPATDAWMAGDRYGTVVSAGSKHLSVEMDVSGKTRKVLPFDILEAYEGE